MVWELEFPISNKKSETERILWLWGGDLVAVHFIMVQV